MWFLLSSLRSFDHTTHQSFGYVWLWILFDSLVTSQIEVSVLCLVTSVMSDSLLPHGPQPSRLLCYPTDHSPPGFFVHGNLQARILESVAIFFSRGSSWARDQALISCNAGGFFTTEPAGKPFLRNISSQGPFLTTSLQSIHFFFFFGCTSNSN